jgi:hypothetical protein
MPTHFRLGDGATLSVVPPLAPDVADDVWRHLPGGSRHLEQIERIQKFRGGVYVRDGAIPDAALDPDGRHISPLDYQSWHAIICDRDDHLIGCGRIALYANSTPWDEFRFAPCLARMDAALAADYRAALDACRAAAKRDGLRLAEQGGWAVAEPFRAHSGSILFPLAGWALTQLVGPARSFGTTTTRHGASRILRRLGFAPLAGPDGRELPPYFDRYHDCAMEIMTFDSRHPSPKYAPAIAEIRSYFEQLASDHARTVTVSLNPTLPAPRQPAGQIYLDVLRND